MIEYIIKKWTYFFITCKPALCDLDTTGGLSGFCWWLEFSAFPVFPAPFSVVGAPKGDLVPVALCMKGNKKVLLLGRIFIIYLIKIIVYIFS